MKKIAVGMVALGLLAFGGQSFDAILIGAGQQNFNPNPAGFFWGKRQTAPSALAALLHVSVNFR